MANVNVVASIEAEKDNNITIYFSLTKTSFETHNFLLI